MDGLKSIVKSVNLHPLVLILAIGLLHGGLYLLLVPPWQHYDEPTHFEYAWLIANEGRLPTPGSFDSTMHREVAASMIEHGFFEHLARPNLLLDNTWIGIPQTSDPPLYYLLAAVPLLFLKGADITVQLHAVRFLSLCMFLFTLWVSYQITIEIFPKHKFFHWFFPVSIALTPAFVDLMTAVNNDVGATAIFSVFLWLGVRLLQRGVTLTGSMLFLLVAIACFYTKNTVFLALPLTLFLPFFILFKAPLPWRRLAWPILVLTVGALSLFIFSWQDAAFWYRSLYSVQQNTPTQTQGTHAEQALALHFSPEEKGELNLLQPLRAQTTASLAGKAYTLGAWVWATEAIQAQAPALTIDGEKTDTLIAVTTTPTFFSVSGTIPSDVQFLNILLDPFPQPLDHAITLYYDDVILVEGASPHEDFPVFSRDHATGTWDAQPFTNLVRNSTAEQTWLTIHPALLFRFREQTNLPPYALPALQDYSLTGGIYKHTVINLFQSFWARFGWNQIGLPAFGYSLLGGFTLIGISGAILGGGIQLRKREPQFLLVLAWFAVCMGLIWSAAFARQTLPFWENLPFTPSARYAYPVILPTSMFILGGWGWLAYHYPRIKILAYLPIAILGVLDITSLMIIMQSYHME